MNEGLQRAGFEKRCVAFLIDHVILSIIMTIGLFGFAWDLLQTAFELTFLVVMLVIFMFYFSKDIVGGASIGKRVMGLAVRSNDNADLTPSYLLLFLRNIPIVVWPIEAIALLCSDNYRRIGDKLAGTAVYTVSPKVTPRAIVAVVISLIAAFALTLTITVTMVMRNHESYRVAISYIEASEEIKSITGDITEFGFFISGGFSTINGYGDADYSIRVRGEFGSARVRVRLESTPISEGWVVVGVWY